MRDAYIASQAQPSLKELQFSLIAYSYEHFQQNLLKLFAKAITSLPF
ncbi:hypothetical protein BLGI_2011 [Brevibacillus laterosporus GI-9]|nr:hypothetical protein BLGI_2011 [Brevibacillus laterosporus GI-9]